MKILPLKILPLKILTLIILSSLLINHKALAQDLSVELAALKDLSLQTQVIEQVSSFTGKEMMAQVASLPGQAYVFKSPIDVQQIQYLKGNGALLNKDQAFAIIQGPEVHHFYMAYEMKKVLFKQATAHFDNSKNLYARKSLSEQAWLDISEDYHNFKMEFDELTHFFDLVLSFDDKNDALTLGAPANGILQYSVSAALNMDGIIASFVPTQAIRLKVNTPINMTVKPSYFNSGNCQLAVDFTELADNAFHQTAWTEALREQCDFVIGQVLSARPVYETNAYKVKKSSVFNWEGGNYIFVLNNTRYEALKVTLITSQNENYILNSEASLANKTVLTSSVSAVQGMLQGLGL
jgi:hypothetical protein